MAARAIVWLCWGARFIREATESARSTAAIEADRILVTDAATADFARAQPEFTSVIPIELAYANNLEKSRLIDIVPAGYETYLYLDTDTRIVGDISLAFAKAERHGIAMAPAPNYNLPEYFNFAPIMRDLGTEPADQIMYNAGVIFFRLTPRVRQVLELWRDLCANVGAKRDFHHDQPFLTLALEQLDVTPYVLSPLYNYRSLGEYAVGNIRLWHSHSAPPEDFNQFDNAWPARRFRDGMRLPSNTDEPPRWPQGMLQLPHAPFTRTNTAAAAEAIIAQALAIRDSPDGNRAAVEYLVEQVGLCGSFERDEAYFAEALHFHLGLLYAHMREPEKMAPHLSLSRTMPNREADQLFSDHVNASHAVRHMQAAALSRGLPAVLIACMPRSASASFVYTVARKLDLSPMQVSVGQFPNYFLVPSWLDMFLEGGAITQDHFAANAFNIGVLRQRGPREIFVLIRDPRAAARSQVHHLARTDGGLGAPLATRIEEQCVNRFIPWLQEWIDCANDPDLPFRIHWLTYREVCDDPAAVLRRICGAMAKEYPAMASFADCRALEEMRVHFVEGINDAWQVEVDHETRERLWAALTPEIKSMLKLRW